MSTSYLKGYGEPINIKKIAGRKKKLKVGEPFKYEDLGMGKGYNIHQASWNPHSRGYQALQQRKSQPLNLSIRGEAVVSDRASGLESTPIGTPVLGQPLLRKFDEDIEATSPGELARLAQFEAELEAAEVVVADEQKAIDQAEADYKAADTAKDDAAKETADEERKEARVRQALAKEEAADLRKKIAAKAHISARGRARRLKIYD